MVKKDIHTGCIKKTHDIQTVTTWQRQYSDHIGESNGQKSSSNNNNNLKTNRVVAGAIGGWGSETGGRPIGVEVSPRRV